MVALDNSIINVVIPIIQDTYEVSLLIVEWVITAYALALSNQLLQIGRLIDLCGLKLLYLFGMVIVTLSSLLCGLATRSPRWLPSGFCRHGAPG